MVEKNTVAKVRKEKKEAGETGDDGKPIQDNAQSYTEQPINEGIGGDTISPDDNFLSKCFKRCQRCKSKMVTVACIKLCIIFWVIIGPIGG